MVEIIWILIYTFLLVVAFYLNAKIGMHFTLLKEADIAFVMKGEEIERVILGLKAEDVEEITENLSARGIPWSDKSDLLARVLGIHYVSWIYPFRRLHVFELLAEGIRDGSEGKETPGEDALMREWLYHHRKEVKSLRWRFPRPVLLEGVELADRTTIDIIVMSVLEIKDPYIPVFVFKGNFFPLAASFIESATIDLVVGETGKQFSEGKEMTYSNFVKIDKGEGSDFSTTLRNTVNEGEAAEKKGLISVLGIEAHKAYIFKYGLSKGQEEIEAASRAEAAERMRAKGEVEKARGTAKALRINAMAEARRVRVIADALVEEGVDPNVAAEFIRTLVKTDNVRQAGLSTWLDAEGGLSALASLLKKGGRS